MINKREFEEKIKNNTVTAEDLKKLLDEYKKQEKRLNKIIKIADAQQKEVMQLNDELNEYKNELEKKVEQEIQKRKAQEEMMIKQSKLAAMGEMIDAIAHQWKQPLNIINLQATLIELQSHNPQTIKESKKVIQEQVKHLVDTIDGFRNFFRKNEKKEFDPKKSIEKTLELMKDEITKNFLNIQIKQLSEFKIYGNENEFKHIIINLINNAKDAFNERKIEKREIEIVLREDNENYIIEVIDNAGGIPEDVLPFIFKANFTTKEKSGGTGIGLYLSKLIAEKLNATLEAKNVKNGAKFSLKIKKLNT